MVVNREVPNGGGSSGGGSFQVLVQGTHEAIDAMTLAIDSHGLDEHVPIFAATVDANLNSLLSDAVLVTVSGGTVAAIQSVLVELIRSRRVTVTWRSGDRELHFDGPVSQAQTLQELSDGLARAGDRELPAGEPFPLDAGPAEPAGREPADGEEGVP